LKFFALIYFADDGRGTVTSTYTAETRFSNISPARTYEYAKGTLTNLPHDERGATPTTYTETRTFEAPKPGVETRFGTTTSPGTRTTREQQLHGESRSYPSVVDTPRPYTSPAGKRHEIKERAKSYDQLDSSGFVTDSRSYGTKPSGEYRDLESSSYSVRQYGTGDSKQQQQAPLRYFGEEPAKSGERVTTTYERYHHHSRENIRSDDSRELPISGGEYTRSTFDPEKFRSNGRLRHEKDLPETPKGPGAVADVSAAAESYDRTKSDITADRQQKAPFQRSKVLERSEELERLPKSWKSVEKIERESSYYRESTVKTSGRVDLDETRRYPEESRKKGIRRFR
uniref:SYNEM protein n=1 Tax=Gongylonema pulchrum TaxID=637853 RepID=A0A183DBW1_9BILA